MFRIVIGVSRLRKEILGVKTVHVKVILMATAVISALTDPVEQFPETPVIAMGTLASAIKFLGLTVGVNALRAKPALMSNSTQDSSAVLVCKVILRIEFLEIICCGFFPYCI